MKRVNLLFTLVALVVIASCTTDPKVQSSRYVANGDKFYDRGRFKEASIMYRRALQKNMKNADAWYKVGLVSLKDQQVGEARGELIRVCDLAEESKRWTAVESDALSKIADIDYTIYMELFEKLQAKQYFSDLKHRVDLMTAHYPRTFDAYRVEGLYYYADSVLNGNVPRKPADRAPYFQKALASFEAADKIRPYDTTVGFAVVSALADNGQVAEAEKYANEMITRKTADERVYYSLYMYYLRTGKIADAEGVRKRQAQNNPTVGLAWINLASHYWVTKNMPAVQATLDKLTSDLKTFPDAYLLVGDFFFSFGDLNTAIAKYQQGVKVDSANKIKYWKKEAEADALLGKNDDAAKLVSALLKADANDPEAIAMDASLQLNHSKPEDADKIIARLQPVLAKTSPNENARATILHFNLGRAYALKGDPQSLDQSRLQFQDAVNANPKKPYVPALMALAQLELQRNDNPNAIEHATQVLKLDPANMQARLVRSLGLANLGEYDRSRQELDQVMKAKPDSRDARFQLGRLDFIQQKYAEAEREFEELRKVNDPRGLNGIIESRVAQGRTEEAIQMIKDELAKSPSNLGYQNGLATLYYNGKRYPEAVTLLRDMIAKNPNADANVREGFYIRLGETQRRMNDLDGAKASFLKASEIAPKHAGAKLELAMLVDTEGKTDEARQGYEDVLKLDPDNPIALNNLAYIKADSGKDLDQALAIAQKARAKAPKDPNVIDTLGLIYFKKDLLPDSLRMFQDLVNQAPNNPTYRLHLAMALYKQGDKPRARRELDSASKNSPNVREQEQIRELSAKL